MSEFEPVKEALLRLVHNLFQQFKRQSVHTLPFIFLLAPMKTVEIELQLLLLAYFKVLESHSKSSLRISGVYTCPVSG